MPDRDCGLALLGQSLFRHEPNAASFPAPSSRSRLRRRLTSPPPSSSLKHTSCALLTALRVRPYAPTPATPTSPPPNIDTPRWDTFSTCDTHLVHAPSLHPSKSIYCIYVLPAWPPHPAQTNRCTHSTAASLSTHISRGAPTL